jgi:hypothetical protein
MPSNTTNKNPQRRSGALPTGPERSRQIEAMQGYDRTSRGDKYDQIVQRLQLEFPKIDGSVIAALYGDTKNLGSAREMLNALENGQ